MLTLDKAIELVGKLERTRNYPRDLEGKGIDALARGLIKASEALKVAGGRIVDKCSMDSEWCPTDAEFYATARELARLDAVANGSYDSTAGYTNSFRELERPPCARCSNSGWEMVYTLHTVGKDGQWKRAKREDISEAQAKDLETKIGNGQRVYSGARRCTACTPHDWAKRTAGDL